MYGIYIYIYIYANIGGIFMVNVTILHGSYGLFCPNLIIRAGRIPKESYYPLLRVNQIHDLSVV